MRYDGIDKIKRRNNSSGHFPGYDFLTCRDTHIPVKNISIRILGEHFFQHFGMVEGIAAVHEDEVFALCKTYPLVHRVVDTGIGFGDEATDPPGIGGELVERAVARSSVNDNPFEILPRLMDNTFGGFRNAGFFVAADGDDGEFGHGRQVAGVCLAKVWGGSTIVFRGDLEPWAFRFSARVALRQ